VFRIWPGSVRAARWQTGAMAVAAALLLTAAGLTAGVAPGPGALRLTSAAATAAPVLAWGDNSAGELGDATLTASDLPAAVQGLAGVQGLSAGGRHELAVLADGTVEAWGDDTFGQLGNGIVSSNGDSEAPSAVPDLTGATAVAAGEEHSLALLSNGTVMAWGDNLEGQLGDGTTQTSAVPVQVKGLSGVTAIAAGSQFSLALLADGTVMAWGKGDAGQLGDGNTKNSLVPVTVSGLSDVTAIAAGSEHALALLSDGTMMAWGDNEFGQLGDGGTESLSDVPVAVAALTGVQSISAGFQHSVALLSTGAVMAWGDNSEFQLGQSNGFPGGIASSNVPVAVPGVGAATAIAAGGYFSLAVVAGGAVMAWGDNSFGQLGNGTAATGPAAVTVKGLSGVSRVAAGGDASFAFGPAAEPAQNVTPAASTASAAVAGPVSSPWRVTADPANPGGTDGLKDVLFSSVSATSDSDVWGVGAFNALSSSQPLAEHYDGTTWQTSAVPLPAGETVGELAGVDAVSSDNVWAVGSVGQGSGSQRTLIENWDGTSWAVVPSPDPETGSLAVDSLTAVAGTADNLWAVGDYSDGMTFNAMLFEHWNGTAWSFVTEPPALHSLAFGAGVTVISATDAWAVGSTLGVTTVSAHWNGKKWISVKTPFLDNGKAPVNFLTGVAAAGPDDVWASGYENNVNQENFRKPYMLHWNGKTWTLTLIPNEGSEGALLASVTALSSTDVWAAGQTQEDDGALLSLTERFNGQSWSVAPSLDPGELADAPDSTFTAITSVPPHTLLAVGTMETPTVCCLETLAEHSATG
jgi:alpha-tubulin suppressor-like RCC1 family protein